MLYDVHDDFQCSKCPLATQLQRCCTRMMDAETRAHHAEHIDAYPEPNTPKWRELACMKLRTTHDALDLIQEAQAYLKHGQLPLPGGLWDQPLWWWRRVQAVASAMGEFDAALDDKAKARAVNSIRTQLADVFTESGEAEDLLTPT